MSELPSGWATAPIAELVRAVASTDLRTGVAASATWQYIDVGSLRNGGNVVREVATTMLGNDAPSRARQLLRDGDVLVSTVRPNLRKVAMVESSADNLVGSTAFCVLRATPGINQSWLYYACQLPSFTAALVAKARGVSYPAVLDRDVLGMNIAVPPVDEQRRIVQAIDEAFSKLDAGVRYLEAAHARLLRLGHAAAAQLIPSSAPRSSLAALTTEQRNGVFVSRPASEPPGVPILRIGAVRPLLLNLDDHGYAPLGSEETHRKGLLSAGELLFTRYNGNPAFVGACAVVPRLDGPMLHPDKLIKVRVNAALAIPEYVAIACSFGDGREQIRSCIKTTAGQTGISGSDLSRVQIALPSLPEQLAIVNEFEHIAGMQGRMDEQLNLAEARAKRLRRATLEAAFTGRLADQDSNDEAAQVLLERIRTEREASTPVKKTATKKSKAGVK